VSSQVEQLLPPLARSLAGFTLAGITLALLHLAAPVVTPVLFAFFLAALAMPAFRWLERRGVKRGVALLLLVLALLAGGLALIVLAITSVGRLQEGLSVYGEGLAERMDELSAALSGLGLADTGNRAGAALTSVMGGLLRAIASVASSAVVSLAVVAFFLLESDRFIRILRSDAAQDRPLLREMPQVARTAIQYFAIRTRLNLVTGAGVILICLLLGVDYPLLWGLVAFVLSYIPYIGLATAMIPPTLLALAERGWGAALVVVLGITALNLTIENVLEPGYTGRRLHLSPTVVFLSFFFWAWLLGPIGALLSMPITVMLLLVCQRDGSTRWLAEMIGRAAT
jgi:predicted PurR-regulated permease PerM